MTQETPERPLTACPECHEIGRSNVGSNGVRFCENDNCQILAYREREYVR